MSPHLIYKALDQFYEYYGTMFKGYAMDNDPVIEDIVDITASRPDKSIRVNPKGRYV